MKLVRFAHAVVKTTTSVHDGAFTKAPDHNAVIWFHKSVGRWMFVLSTHYVADQYGYIGSDSTKISLVVCRNPR